MSFQKRGAGPLGSIYKVEFTEAATGGVFLKKVFLKMSGNSQENIFSRVSFSINLQALGMQPYLKKRFWHKCFSLNFAKFFITPFLQNTSSHYCFLIQKSHNIITDGFRGNKPFIVFTRVYSFSISKIYKT